MSRPSVYAAAVFLLAGVMAGARPSSPAVLAQPAPTTDPFSQSGGAMNCAEAVGDIVWLCSGPRLLAVDAADPSAPKVIGRSDELPGLLHALVLDEAGRQAWALATDYVVGLDVTDPMRPNELGRLYVGGTGYGQSLALARGRLWLHGPEEGTVLGIDIGDPRRPKVATSIDIRSQAGGYVEALAARGTRLYVLARVGSTDEPVEEPKWQDQIQVFDLSLGSEPLRVQTVNVPTDWVKEDGAFTWDGDLLWATTPHKLRAWRGDSQALVPAVEGELDGCYRPVGFLIQDARAYVSCSTGFADNLAVMVYDLRPGREFQRLAMGPVSYEDAGLYSPAVALTDGTVWISDGAGQLRGLEVGSGATVPTLRAAGQLSLIGVLSRVTLDEARDRLLAECGWDGMFPVELADLDHPDVGPALVRGFHIGHIAVDGDRLLLEYGGDGDALDSRVELRDLSDPTAAPEVANSRLLLQLGMSYSARRPFSLVGPRLIAAVRDDRGSLNSDRLALWNLPVGGMPSPAADWLVPGAILAMAQEGTRVAAVSDIGLSDAERRLNLMTVDVVTGIRRDLQIPMPTDRGMSLYADLAIVGDTLWLALARTGGFWSGNERLQILMADLADPSGLRVNAAWDEALAFTDRGPVRLERSRAGDLLFLSQAGTVRVFTPQAVGLRPLAELHLPARVSDMAITPVGDWIFLAADANGLFSVRRPAAGWEALPTPLPPTVTPTATTSPTASATPTATATMVVRSRSWLPLIARRP